MEPIYRNGEKGSKIHKTHRRLLAVRLGGQRVQINFRLGTVVGCELRGCDGGGIGAAELLEGLQIFVCERVGALRAEWSGGAGTACQELYEQSIRDDGNLKGRKSVIRNVPRTQR